MTKQHGLGDRFFYSGFNLSGDTAMLDRVGGGPALVEVTGIDKSAPERLGGLFDGGMGWTSHFNDAVGQSHPTYAALPTGVQQLLYCRGASIGSHAAGLQAKQLNYDPTRDEAGKLTFKLEGVAAQGFGLEWGRLLTAGARTDTTATNGASLDGAAASAQGLTAYLQVLAFSGTSVTVTLQESSDDGAGDAFAAVTGGAFAAASVVGSQRIQTAAGLSVERYLRAVTTGTFTSATFVVMVVRHEVAMRF